MKKGKLYRGDEFLRDVLYELSLGEKEETPVSTYGQTSSVEGHRGATTGRLADDSGEDRPFFDLQGVDNIFLERQDESRVSITITGADGSFIKGRS